MNTAATPAATAIELEGYTLHEDASATEDASRPHFWALARECWCGVEVSRENFATSEEARRNAELHMQQELARGVDAWT